MAKIRFTDKVYKAVQLVAEGRLTIPEIAREVGASVETVRGWKDAEDFKLEVKKILDREKEIRDNQTIRSKQLRLSRQHERWDAMQFIVRQRKEDFAGKDIPGGESGFIVRRYTKTGINYEVDYPLLKAFLEIEKHAAQEMGDWVEKKEIGGANGGAIPIAIQSAIDKAYGDTGKQPIEADGQADSDCT